MHCNFNQNYAIAFDLNCIASKELFAIAVADPGFPVEGAWTS